MTSENNNRIILFVVGMHRSGTSALTAALRACGASTGDDVIPAQEGVNSDGFWEDKRVVELNEVLLKKSGLDWYLVKANSEISHDNTDVERATQIISDGFGDGIVEVVKDPRFCITLPFWLDICQSLGVTVKICVIDRSKQEIAQSLYKRDGFPVSYGYDLAKNYQLLTEKVPTDISIAYNQLVVSPRDVVAQLVAALDLPLSVNERAVNEAVKPKLKHQIAEADKNLEKSAGCSQLLSEMTQAFVDRGHKLTELGEMHSYALSIVEERDKELAEIKARLRWLKPIIKILRILGLINHRQQQ